MELFITLTAFVLIFGLLIFVHELGHFLVAKRNGIKVEEFAFGLPLLPKILGVKRGETTYSVYPVPLGGFVKMLGEEGGSKSKRSFATKSAGTRAKVLVAGVAMNFLLAFVLLSVGFAFKMDPLALCARDYPNTTYQNDVTVTAVTQTGTAKQAGVQAGDTIRRINGQEVACQTEVPKLLKQRANQPTALGLERGGQPLELTATPNAAGKVGLAPRDDYKSLDYPRWQAPYLAAIETIAVTGATIQGISEVFSQLFTRATVPEGVAGPVGIAKLTGEIVTLGPIVILRFIAIISLSLAIFNLLPIPALDGGRLLFVGIEALRGGKTVSPKVENAIHAAGFAFLIGFILFITYFDITR